MLSRSSSATSAHRPVEAPGTEIGGRVAPGATLGASSRMEGNEAIVRIDERGDGPEVVGRDCQTTPFQAGCRVPAQRLYGVSYQDEGE